jgi:hypothetical protein
MLQQCQSPTHLSASDHEYTVQLKSLHRTFLENLISHALGKLLTLIHIFFFKLRRNTSVFT